ncbi:MAG: hypothetical protein A2428_16055 [Bdellovibrionales bacterium RIFOXYC1_FULL_54_43]|nr:MAG: hypothetical protein A2428_16055 [Bdellovibrionales bacterium RIFOXYC1_FULL_54_43]OFZ81766.1 MAG: hypothetical protein A2603_16870 [Bdellovibrionales bacterium RIFOXYD1_FULL_55_31]
MNLQRDANNLDIYSEVRKRRVYVGRLSFEADNDLYIFRYDPRYAASRTAIPLGPELDLFKKAHTSKRGKLFPSLQDRIPSRENPAYVEYCRSQGISQNEKNPIILLGTIGRRGPSTFVFESVFATGFIAADIVRFRKLLNLTRHEFCMAFDFNEQTIQRIETNKSRDLNVLRRAEIYLSFPEVALWQLRLTGARVHHRALENLTDYFEKKAIPSKEQFRLT